MNFKLNQVNHSLFSNSKFRFFFLFLVRNKNGKNYENNPTITVAVCFQQVLGLYIF